jgi:conjugal transfer ATP-binding protein TraC
MYEIPTQLEYKEKIVFGLTFVQLFYALIFLPIIFSLLFKVNASISVRILLALIPTLLAVGFMFFDLFTKIKDWYTWFKIRQIRTEKQKKLDYEKKQKELEKRKEEKQKKKEKKKTKKEKPEKKKVEKKKFPRNDVRDFFKLKNITEDFVYSENKKIAVIGVDSLNFGIKSEKEQEAIILTFQKLLNSIDFSIQILMTTETLNLEEYLDYLGEKIHEKRNQEIFDSYKDHMKGLVEKNSAMNRNFYIVIPEVNDIEVQMKLCEERLHSLNLKTYRLKGKELNGVFSKIFGSKKILPESIQNYPDYFKIGNKFHKIIYAHGYPRSVQKGFLDKLISCSGNFDFSLHIAPQPIETTLVLLNKELQKQRADLYSAKLKNQLNPSLEIKYADTKAVLTNLQKGNEKLFNIGLYINCRADSVEELQLLARKIESELNSLMIIPRKPNFRMLQGFKSCLPLAKDFLNMPRNITTSALSAFFPFTSSFFKFDNTGIWFGLNKNNIPIIRDIFKLSNSNGMCLASSGAGKSYMTKLFITRHLLNGTKTIVIDPQSEYTALVRKFEGQRIDLSRKSKTIINPLDLMGHDYAEKRLSLMDLMPVMLGQLTEPQKSFIDQALTEAYERKDIFMNDKSSWSNEPPILGDVLDALQKMEETALNLERTTLRSLINRLKLYVEGVFSFLNRHTKINFKNNFVCFDIGSMPKQVKPTIMFLVLDYVYMKMRRDLERKILVIDEAWTLLSRAEEASYIFEIVKTCRKFNMGLFLINQEVEGMLDSQAGRSALANSSYTILLRQKPAVIDGIQKVFHLSNVERMALLTAGVGEGILLMEDEHSELKIVASEEEHKQITTKADELLVAKPEKKRKGKKANATVDDMKRVHLSKDLSEDDKVYLIRKNFEEVRYKGIEGKFQKYFVKKYKNESSQHMIWVYEISKHISKFTKNVQTPRTAKADIIFEAKGRRYGIEVETGKVLVKDKSKTMRKIEALNKDLDKNWFFFVTNLHNKKKYQKLGSTVDNRGIRRKISSLFKK